jgi:methanogenic corrinoid protein MtbC1
MGGRFGADFLEMAGFEVRFLGANVPTRSLLSMVERERPDVVGLSAAMSFHLPALRAAVEGVRALRGEEFPIIVGGHVLEWSPALSRELGVQALGTCADRLVKGCREYLGC